MFIPIASNIPEKREIKPEGPRDAKIIIVGDFATGYEMRTLRPFQGPAGNILEQCLHAAGLLRSEVYLTTVIKEQPKDNDVSPFFNVTKGTFTEKGIAYVNQLREELNSHPGNVIVACGAVALAALAGVHKVLKFRGYVFDSIGLTRPRQVLATIHPSASLRGQYAYRHLITADLKKASTIQFDTVLVRPNRQLVYTFYNVEEVLQWLSFYEQQPIIAFDIEVLNYEMSCISFSSDPGVAISVPLAGRWSEYDELLIWRALQRLLGNPRSIKVAQNGIFDIQFLYAHCWITVRGEVRDTMIAHHIMYPEFQKSLGFLGSLYCGNQRYWKDQVSFKSIKEED